MTTPVFIDLETRSACDLKKSGGWQYAAHPSTRILTAAWTADMGATYHLWMPGADHVPPASAAPLIAANVTIHPGRAVPDALKAVASGHTWVGHNAWTFDRAVWAALGGPDAQPDRWVDTYPLALACSLPGGLGKIGNMLWGEGKYEEGAKALKKASRCKGTYDCDPGDVPLGTQLLVAKYNVQDVKLMVDLWPVLLRECRLTPHEREVLAAHDACTQRGVRLDRRLITALRGLADEAKAEAVKQIAELTKGFLPDQDAVQSRTKIFAWLEKMKVSIGTSLRKEVVAKFIAENRKHGEGNEDPDTDEGEDTGPDGPDEPDAEAVKNLPVVVKVLELRMQALRITGGKLDAAQEALDADGCARGLHVYWGAHTGRDAGRRIQTQNLPRPKEGVDCWGLLTWYDQWAKPQPAVGPPVEDWNYHTIRNRMPIGERGADGKLLYPYLSVDDAASGMLRSIIIPNEGEVLHAADLANIEARILAWLAGEVWLMKAFWEGTDPYLAMAERVFGPSDRWPKFPDPKKAGKFLPLKKHPYRQTGKVVVLGSGYQLGANKFAVYAASNGIDLDAVGTTPQACILAFRRMHTAIAGDERMHQESGHIYFRGGFWDQLDEAAVHAVTNREDVQVGVLNFGMEGRHLIVTLPSGRRLVYRDAELSEQTVFGRTRHGVTYVSARFGRTKIYGGKWAENVTQAVARDVLMHGFVLCEAERIPVVLRVHDELAASAPEDRFPDFMRCVTTRPDWLTDFPLDAEGSFAPRYAKSASPEWKKRFGDAEALYRNGAPHK